MSRRVRGKHHYILSWFNKQAIDKTPVYNALRDANILLHLNTTRDLYAWLEGSYKQVFVSGVCDAFAKLWDIRTGKAVQTFAWP